MTNWIVIDLMTGAIIDRCETEREALVKCVGKPYDVQFKRSNRKKKEA